MSEPKVLSFEPTFGDTLYYLTKGRTAISECDEFNVLCERTNSVVCHTIQPITQCASKSPGL